MNQNKGEKHMSNTTLAKLVGLYQILNPESTKFSGFNVYHLVFGSLISYLSLVSVIVCINGLYYWTDHRTESILHFASAEIFVYSCYKMSILIRKSREIRDCLSVTRFDFTPYGGCRNASLLETWRNRILLFTSAFAIGYMFATLMFASSPVVFRNGFTTMKSFDGSQSEYRINLLNLYAIWSAETYNTHFGLFYAVEVTGLTLFIFFNVVFDTLMITLCLSFVSQLRMIKAAFESSGPKRFIEYSVQNKNEDEIGSNVYFYSPYEHLLSYNELKTIIMDHQAIIKIFEHFFSIFQDVMLSQIIVSTSVNIAVLLNLTTKFADGEINDDSSLTIMKMMSATPFVIFQHFGTCYLFESLHNEKESIGFALYSSNWTEMDMKCRNLILLTMRMNNAHKRKLKFSQLRIVNLEMFFSTMRICYSVLSVMLNYKSK